MPAPGRTITILVGLLATVMLGWVIHVGAGILQPLVIALFLCSMLGPVVSWLAKRHIPPTVTVIALVSLLFWGAVRGGVWVQNQVMDYVSGATAEHVEPGAEFPDPPPEAEPPSGPGEVGASGETPAEPNDREGLEAVRRALVSRLQTSNLPPAVQVYLVSALYEIDGVALATNLVGTGLGFLKGLSLVVIYMLFIFAEQAIFRRKILSAAGERSDDAAGMLDHIARGIQRYLSVKTVISLLTGLLCFAVLRAMDMQYAALFGVLTYLLNYIPTFGSLIAGVLATATVFAVKGSWESSVIVAGTYLAVNFALGNFLEPKILGRELDLSPLVIIISVVVWAGLWGVVGTFLAVPLTATIQIILSSSETTRPIALLLSSGPSRDPPFWKRRRPPVDAA